MNDINLHIRLGRLPQDTHQKMIDDCEYYVSGEGGELLRENGQTPTIKRYKKLIKQFTHFGTYRLEIPENQEERDQFLNILNKVIKTLKNARLSEINGTLGDLRGAGEAGEISLKNFGLSYKDREAFLQQDGKKVLLPGGETRVTLAVSSEPLQFTPGKTWKIFERFFPFIEAFTPHPHGPKSDSKLQKTAAGKIALIGSGIVLSPLLLSGSLLFLLGGGPFWDKNDVEFSIAPEARPNELSDEPPVVVAQPIELPDAEAQPLKFALHEVDLIPEVEAQPIFNPSGLPEAEATAAS